MQKETKGAGAPRHFTFKEKLAALGPGFLICGSFIGPGTVTSSTRAGAGYGYELLWCIVFSVCYTRYGSTFRCGNSKGFG